MRDCGDGYQLISLRTEDPLYSKPYAWTKVNALTWASWLVLALILPGLLVTGGLANATIASLTLVIRQVMKPAPRNTDFDSDAEEGSAGLSRMQKVAAAAAEKDWAPLAAENAKAELEAAREFTKKQQGDPHYVREDTPQEQRGGMLDDHFSINAKEAAKIRRSPLEVFPRESVQKAKATAAVTDAAAHGATGLSADFVKEGEGKADVTPGVLKPLRTVLYEQKKLKDDEYAENTRIMTEGHMRPLNEDEVNWLNDAEEAERVKEKQRKKLEQEELESFTLAAHRAFSERKVTTTIAPKDADQWAPALKRKDIFPMKAGVKIVKRPTTTPR